MGNFVIFTTKVVMFFINVSRFFKGKLGDGTETEIMKMVEQTISDFFGGK